EAVSDEGGNMFRTTHPLKKIAAAFTLAAAVAALAAPSALAGKADGRSPDTRDAAAAAHVSYGSPDGWYPWAVAQTTLQNRRLVDGRSPDTLDAAFTAHEPVVTVVRASGFDWGDFGIGIAAALGLMLLVA